MPEPVHSLANLTAEEKRKLLAELLRSRAAQGAAGALAYGQRALWYLHGLEPESAFYNVPWAWRISSTLDAEALRRAFRSLLDRHRILRTTYVDQNGQPVARTVDGADVDFLKVSAEGWSDETLHDRISRDAHQPFDLARDPVMRVRLYTRAAEDHVLLVTFHHIAYDLWSMMTLLNELGVLYSAHRAGATPVLPPAAQYEEFVQWQSDMLGRADGERLWRYWQQQMKGEPPVVTLPLDRPRPAVQTFHGATHTARLDDRLVQRLHAFSHSSGHTLFTILMSAFDVLLARYTGHSDIVVGSPMTGRTRPEHQGIVGYCLNAVPLRGDLSGNPTFTQLLDRMRLVVLGALEHQDYPFALLVERLRPARDPSYATFFHVMFALNKPHRREEQAISMSTLGESARLELGALGLDFYPVEHQAAVSDVALLMFEFGDQLFAGWEYNTDLFDKATIVRMERQFARLLESIVENPDARLSDLDLLAEEERQLVVAGWNDTKRPYPSDRTIAEIFQSQAANHPDAVAVVAGDTRLTYAELNRRANQLAQLLIARGVGEDALVGVFLDRSPDIIVALLGILKAGGAYLPLDPSYPKERLAFMLEDARSPILLTERRLLESVPDYGGQVVCLDVERDLLAAQSDTDPAVRSTPDHLAYVTYTSGSTGRPKGVEVRQRGVTRLLFGVDYVRLDDRQRFLLLAPVSFDASTLEIWGALLHGASLALFPERVPAADTLAEVLRRERVSVLWLTASLFNAIVDERPSALAGVRQLLIGGEALSAAHVRRAQLALPDTQIINGYGPTESTTFTCCYPIPPLAADHLPSVSIGRPIGNTQVYVLDAALAPVPVGVPGELFIGGDGLARGYLNRPELTAEKFVPDGVSGQAGARLYRTGDLVRWRPDGAIDFLGRIDDQVKIRGFRIEPGEIEAALTKHKSVREAVVVAREDVRGEKRLVAYVVPQDSSSPEAEAPGDWEDSRVAEWRRVYDDVIYENVGPDAGDDPTFNITGWISTYTGRPIPPEAMREQVEQTVARIRRGAPRRVLEIGCGTGLLLFRIAPHCDRYFGTDFSRVSLDFVSARLPEAIRDRVRLSERLADDFSDLEPKSFDAVIINSVVQYFPGAAYFKQVIEGALGMLAPGGRIFVGDVRSLPLLETFHTAVQVFQAPATLEPPALARRIDQQLSQEQELVVSPAFFRALAAEHSEITALAVEPKRGQARHELTEFRYDVTIEVAGQTASEAQAAWHRWTPGLDLEGIRRALAAAPATAIGWQSVPNQRVAAAVESVRLLSDERAANVAEIRALSTAAQGIDPESLWALAETLPYTVDVSWSAARRDGSFDVLFRPRLDAPAALPAFPADPLEDAPITAHANNPREGTIARGLTLALRAYLSEGLPEYMVPSAFVVLDSLPLTPNGKVDWRALPAPDQSRPEVAETFTKPRSPIEQALADIFADVLRIERVGIDDNFFDLGGHSLLATQVVSRVRAAFQAEVSLRQMFEAQTVAGLAAVVEKARHGEAGRASVIPRASHDADIPLSFAQQRLWFLDRLEAGAAYAVPCAIRLTGRLDVDALERSINEIVRRHEALRTTFPSAGGRPSQVVSPSLVISLQRADLRNLAEPDREAEAARLAAAEAIAPFNLATGPLLRCTLIRLGEREHVLLFTMHHIVSDGWSLGVLSTELTALYNAFSIGESSPLPELPIQYADFAVWQRDWLEGDELASQSAYWHERLRNLPTLNLATDHPRPARQSFRGAAHVVEFPSALSSRLTEFGRREGVTLFMTLLAALQTYLHRCTGQDDIVVGSPIANRNRGQGEIEKLIGFFVNTLVMRTDLSNNPTFAELMRRVREVVLGAYDHQDLPFEKLVEDLQPERELNRNPLFQIDLVVENAPVDPLKLREVTSAPFFAGDTATRFDLELLVWEHAQSVTAVVVYATDLFEAATIERMMAQFITLLEDATTNPNRRLSDLALTTPGELRQLAAWNATAVDYPLEQCLHDHIEAQVARTPDAIAVSFEGDSLTYSQLDRRANQLAHALRSLGVGCESTVGVCLERSIDLVVSLLAILKAGGAYVPLDPSYPRERLATMLTDARPPVLLTHERLAEDLSFDGTRVVCLDRDRATIDDRPSTRPAPSATPDSLAYAIFTSGSTGRPKGAMNTHRAICNRLLWMQQQYGLGPGDRVLQKTPFSFDVSVWEFFWPLMVGARLVVARPGGHQDPSYLVDVIARERITTLHFVPSMLQVFLEERNLDRCSSLARVVCSGEALGHELQERFHRLLPAELHNLYGPTEAAVDVTYWACRRGGRELVVPIGYPVANTQLHILDRWGRLAPIGVPGELHLGGIQVGRGYLHRPDLTAERFVPDPFSKVAGARLYKTGDLARYLADGAVEYLGRLDHQVKIRGVRIELGEIEAILTQHRAVREAVVVARDDGGGDKRLIAYLVPKALESTGDDRGDWDAEHVAQWQMLYDDTYSRPLPGDDPTFNIVSWNSSYTGQPIPPEEMREWVDQTVDRIAARSPRRVLEIGCGTGLLLWRLAPSCERYTATDFSATVIAGLQAQLDGPYGRSLTHVDLHCRPADRFDGFAEKSYDAVVLNSVVQYFPGIDYLVSVLEGAARMVAPGGSIFIGDVRSLPLLETYHTSVQLHRSADTLDVSELAQRVKRQIVQEEELVIDPAFFSAIARHVPGITAVSMRPKRGRHHNELTKFRYDVVLHAGRTPSIEHAAAIDWRRSGMSVQRLRDLLVESAGDRVSVKGVPNARVSGDVAAAHAVLDGGGRGTVGDLRTALAASDRSQGVDPESLSALAAELGYQTDILWSDSARDGSFDAVFRRPGVAETAIDPFKRSTATGVPSWRSFANNPLHGAMSRQLLPEIRKYLDANVPTYLMPSAFVLLDSLPLSPNGKVDRRALPAPDYVRPDLLDRFEAPGTPTEQVVAGVFCEVLGLDQVGVHDSFFQLGGHSLLATQVVSRLFEYLQVEIEVRTIFEQPSTAGLAAAVLADPHTRERTERIAEMLLSLSDVPDEQLEGFVADKSLVTEKAI